LAYLCPWKTRQHIPLKRPRTSTVSLSTLHLTVQLIWNNIFHFSLTHSPSSSTFWSFAFWHLPPKKLPFWAQWFTHSPGPTPTFPISRLFVPQAAYISTLKKQQQFFRNISTRLYWVTSQKTKTFWSTVRSAKSKFHTVTKKETSQAIWKTCDSRVAQSKCQFQCQMETQDLTFLQVKQGHATLRNNLLHV
jgi:hypothetical protein